MALLLLALFPSHTHRLDILTRNQGTAIHYVPFLTTTTTTTISIYLSLSLIGNCTISRRAQVVERNARNAHPPIGRLVKTFVRKVSNSSNKNNGRTFRGGSDRHTLQANTSARLHAALLLLLFAWLRVNETPNTAANIINSSVSLSISPSLSLSFELYAIYSRRSRRRNITTRTDWPHTIYDTTDRILLLILRNFARIFLSLFFIYLLFVEFSSQRNKRTDNRVQ